MPKYVIIGGSVGAIGAIEAIREVDPAGSIAVISAESPLTYSRPRIGEYLCGEASLDGMMYRNDEFWRSNNVEALIGKQAVGLDLAEKYVRLDGDKKIGFEKLLIATGSKPVIPKIKGVNREGVFTFTSLSDIEGVKARITETSRAVIVGGGLIGICAAEALTKLDVPTTIVELREKILGLLLDTVASNIIRTQMQKEDIKVITGHTVERITGRKERADEVGSAVLDNGERIPCDMIVMAVGITPCIELVLGTEIQTNVGIKVDRFMRTNVQDLYACGDVAEAYDFLSGENRVLPQWPTAYIGGRVAGYNMAGAKVQYPGSTMMNALKYFDVPIIAAGVTNPQDGAGYQILISHQPSNDSYKKVIIRDNKIEGFILVGDVEMAGILFYLMSKFVNVNDFKEKLTSEDFGIVSLPENLRNIMLMEALTR